jgi:uncharacterized protein
MLITVANLRFEPIEFDQQFTPGTIDYGPDIRQIDSLHTQGRADLIEEHRSAHLIVPDIRVRASYKGSFESSCARCVEPVVHTLEGDFDLLYRPMGADGGSSERSISTSETEIGYYGGDSLVLEDVLREQVLVSLPEKTLCRADCKGLCPGCGQNLNAETCSCGKASADPRWTALSDLRSRIEPNIES